MSDMSSLERDTQSRKSIVSDIDKNIFVEAGAGSGKTTMLVDRMVGMIEKGIKIDEICAITFTKAAAGEFYDRFQQRLIKRSTPGYSWKENEKNSFLEESTEESRKLCEEALKNIDLCFMGTIDSFCSMVLSEHPSEAGIPSDVSLLSDEDAELFYKQMYVKICAGDFGENLCDLAGKFRALYFNPEEVFMKGESVIMNNRNVHFNYVKTVEYDLDKDFEKERDDLVKALKVLVDHPELKYDKEQKSVKAWEKVNNSYKNIRRRWSLNFSNVVYSLKALKDIRLIPEALNRYGSSLCGLFVPGGAKGAWLEFVPCKDGSLLSKLQNVQYSVSMTFLDACKDAIEKEMRDKGIMTFFDYLYYLRNMLKKDAEGDGKLIRYINTRHKYFLIDEFQDTNPLQAEVFFYLSSEHPVPQWSACVPKPGSLFIVGDPKQSIYRFRSADVSSFLKVKGLFEKNGGEILSLSRNFRSTSVLCEYFNSCFTEMLPEETADQSKFEEIPIPEPKEDEYQGIYKYTAYIGQLEDEYPEETDPVQIANIINTLVDNENFKLRVHEKEELRRIRYNDIMVITYGKKKLAPLMKFLDEKGIPTRVEGQVPFGANEALGEIYKIYSAVADYKNKISLYGSLNGKLIGLTKDEILKYRECGGSVSILSSLESTQCDDEVALHVDSKIAELRKLREEAVKLSPAALFAKIMDDYRVYEYAEAENLEVVYYALELMRNAEKAGIIVSLKDGAAYISQLIAGESGEERCLSLNDNRDAVHMANLHKVKGLEAPVVILAAAPQFVNNNDKRIVHRDNGSEGYIFKLSRESEDGKPMGSYFETDGFQDEKEAEKAAGAAENQRLIYVAGTRARNVLIVCDTVQAGAKSLIHKSAWKPLKVNLLPDFFESAGGKREWTSKDADTVQASELYKEAEKDNCILLHRELEAGSFAVENPSRVTIKSKMSDEQVVNIVMNMDDTASDSQSEIREKTSEIHIFPALLGTMTHKLMEMLVTTKNTVDSREAVLEIIKEYRTPTTEPYEKELYNALYDVADKMRHGGYEQVNGLPQDMLGTLLAADEVYCEVPFCYTDKGEDGLTIWNGIMDVVYCSQGEWHIVDYKTNADGTNLDKKYLGQLTAYIKAFKETTGFDADAKTYHIDI